MDYDKLIKNNGKLLSDFQLKILDADFKAFNDRIIAEFEALNKLNKDNTNEK